MLCKDILNNLEQDFPLSYAMKWDNPGLISGRTEKQIRKILVAVDITDEVVDRAIEEKADMIVSHHPLIFSPMKRITDENFLGNRLIRLIQNDICVYAIHTNYDVLRMGSIAAERLLLKETEVLEVSGVWMEENEEEPYGIGVIGKLVKPVMLSRYAEQVKKAFDIGAVKVFGDLEKAIETVAVCPGSGSSVIPEAVAKHADVLVTGDIGHHDGIDAMAQDLAVIDAGHYGLEYVFLEDMAAYIKEEYKEIQVIQMPVDHPFVIV